MGYIFKIKIYKTFAKTIVNDKRSGEGVAIKLKYDVAINKFTLYPLFLQITHQAFTHLADVIHKEEASPKTC